jgi:ABC-type bacteriocin/lantibiotic exporter with double-glycine peptidase domain
MQTFKKFLYLLTSREKNTAGLLLLMTFIMALVDMIGVASIMPFVAVLTSPNLVETNSLLNIVFQFSNSFGVKNTQQFLFALGVLVFVILFFSLFLKSFIVYAQARFISMCEYSISKLVLERYLHQPYSWFLNRHSAEIGKTILSEVANVVSGGLGQFIDIVTKGLVAIAIIILLILVDPKLALIVSLIIVGAYGILIYFLRVYIFRIGKQNLKDNELRFISISEAFGAVKEIKVGGLEQHYIKKFSDPARSLAQKKATTLVLKQLPRFILEAIAFGGILIIILYMMSQTNSFDNVLPVISLYAFAGYRLIPAIQGVYTGFSNLTFVTPSINKLYEDLRNIEPINFNQNKNILSVNKKIVLKNIHFNYPNAYQVTINNISLTIPAKSTVGFVGTTGSGKTTIVDIILGLLQPQKGTLEIDEKIITTQNSRSWQRCIGYVPQQIYLTDDTVAANIALGVEAKDLDQDIVEKVSKIAKIHDFVINELPKKYQTTIGERGARLSGGQRQRIGISRALYHNPTVLILDEATNSLDNETEQAVMDAVNNLSKDVTIILIAHLLNTLKNCDIIFKIQKGQLVRQGTYKELINSDKDFISP